MNNIRYMLFGILFAAACFLCAEAACRALRLNVVFNTDFKYFIRSIDNDLECGSNQEDPLTMWAPVPNYNDGDMHINAAGFRGRACKEKKDPGVFRILCMGDSITFGSGVGENEIYHACLEERLNREYAGRGIRFEVINGGVTGYTSLQALVRLREKGLRFSPDAVTFLGGINEPIDRFWMNDRQLMHPGRMNAVRGAERTIFSRSVCYRLLRKGLLKTVFLLRGADSKKPVERVSEDEFRRDIAEMAALCRGKGIAFVLIEPIKRNDPPSDRRVLRQAMRETAAALNIPIVPAGELSEEAPAGNGRLFNDFCHPNREGSRVLMEHLYACLKNNGILPQR